MVKNIEIRCKILSFGTGLKNRSIDLMMIITDLYFKSWCFNLFSGSEYNKNSMLILLLLNMSHTG